MWGRLASSRTDLASKLTSLKLYVFKNIRFAAPPTGNLRWAKPAPPGQQDGVQDGSYGPVCIQVPASGSAGGATNITLAPESEGTHQA